MTFLRDPFVIAFLLFLCAALIGLVHVITDERHRH